MTDLNKFLGEDLSDEKVPAMFNGIKYEDSCPCCGADQMTVDEESGTIGCNGCCQEWVDEEDLHQSLDYQINSLHPVIFNGALGEFEDPYSKEAQKYVEVRLGLNDLKKAKLAWMLTHNKLVRTKATLDEALEQLEKIQNATKSSVFFLNNIIRKDYI